MIRAVLVSREAAEPVKCYRNDNKVDQLEAFQRNTKPLQSVTTVLPGQKTSSRLGALGSDTQIKSSGGPLEYPDYVRMLYSWM